MEAECRVIEADIVMQMSIAEAMKSRETGQLNRVNRVGRKIILWVCDQVKQRPAQLKILGRISRRRAYVRIPRSWKKGGEAKEKIGLTGCRCSRIMWMFLCMKRLSEGGACLMLAFGREIIGQSFVEDCCSHLSVNNM